MESVPIRLEGLRSLKSENCCTTMIMHQFLFWYKVAVQQLYHHASIISTFHLALNNYSKNKSSLERLEVPASKRCGRGYKGAT
jgi:hypothetical protein